MGEHLFKNWPIYILLSGFVWFVAYLLISTWKKLRKEREQNKPQEKK